MLCRLSFKLFRYLNIWHQCKMSQSSRSRRELKHHLSYGFDKRLTFYVTDSSTDFHNCNISALSTQFNATLNFISYVWNNLNSASKIVSPSFILNDLFINFSSCKIILFTSLKPYKSLIVTEIQISLCPIICYKYLSMLKWTHRAWININVWI